MPPVDTAELISAVLSAAFASDFYVDRAFQQLRIADRDVWKAAFKNGTVEMIFTGLPFVRFYADDIWVHWHLSREKARFLPDDRVVLGRKLAFGQMSMDPDKITAISEFAPPTSKKDLERF